MDKTPVPVAGGAPLLLDHCGRCGGVWFEAGEVQRLRAVGADALWRAVARREAVTAAACHACHAPVARGEAACAACGWRVVLDCPACVRPMAVATHDGVRLDVCRSCRGVWFDHEELAAIWRLELGAALRRRGADRLRRDAGDGALVLLDALAWSPELAYVGVRAAGHVAGASAEALANAPAAVGAAAEVAGEAAAGVFESIVEIIGGLFS
jgi:Zn-finger nucleic acid-binding protein